jgi:mono/diheme cytochrome c family protein
MLKAALARAWSGIKWLLRKLLQLAWMLVLLPLRLLRGAVRWLSGLTLRRIWAVAWRGSLVLAAAAALFFFALLHWPHSQVPKVEPPGQIAYLDQGWGVAREAEGRQTYYYTPQGAGNVLRNMRYDWFVHLELPWGRNRLAAPDQMRAYGFQVDAEPTPANPHLLPVGFTRHYDPVLGDEVLDISCAACHTGSLLVVNKQDGSTTSLRIDGGQAMHAFTASRMPHFVPVLLASITSTLVNPLKFKRFGTSVLGADYYAEGKGALRSELWKTLKALAVMGGNEKLHGLAPVEEGYARTDALTRIGNAVFGDHITAANYTPGNAPVSYPPVWDIWKFDWVQYSASVAQPMARNLGESLGVGATFAFFDRYGRPLPEELRYSTTTRLQDLHTIELKLRELRPPVWPEELLGQVDRQQAVAGGLHFIRTCQGCHGPHPASDRQKTIEMPLKSPDDPHWKMKTLTAQEIGTDPNAAVNFVENRYDLTPTGLSIGEVREVLGAEMQERTRRELAYDFPLAHASCSLLPDPASQPLCTQVVCKDIPDLGPGPVCRSWLQARQQAADTMDRSLDSINLAAISNGQGLNYFGLLMRRKLYRELGWSEEKIAEYNGFGALDLPQVAMVYKARPLGGAWATAPYLHNGSVRNLYQLLSPQHERDARFFIGRPEFDTRQVGLASADGVDGGFWLDTRISGNANTGHEFRNGYFEWQPGNPPQFGVIGPAYTPAERYEIIEYLKTHLDDPPHSPLFADVFAGIVAQVMASLPAEGSEAEVATVWPAGQACNLREYLGNHAGAGGLSDALRADVAAIQARLEAYFERPDSYLCGGQTRYQRGG